jgi:hypothetical protein
MKHAGAVALAELMPLLEQLRSIPGLTERKPGIFYRSSAAFLHFHEDPSGLYADAKLHGKEFDRLPVGTDAQRQVLVRTVRNAFAEGR